MSKMSINKQDKTEHTNYEVTRILGARALQIAMDAPYLIDISEEKLEEINYDPMEIAKIEFESGALPITVRKPMPKKKSVKIKKVVTEPRLDEKGNPIIEDEDEKDEEEGEIMELANPEDESLDESSESAGEGGD